MIPTPDIRRLQAIQEEARRLQAEGGWDRAAFGRLLAQASDAARGQGEALNALLRMAEPAWIEGTITWERSNIVKEPGVRLKPTAEQPEAPDTERRSAASR